MKEITQRYSVVLGRNLIEVCVARNNINDAKWAVFVRTRSLKSVGDFPGFTTDSCEPKYELFESFDNDRIKFVGWFYGLVRVEKVAKNLYQSIVDEYSLKTAKDIVHCRTSD